MDGQADLPGSGDGTRTVITITHFPNMLRFNAATLTPNQVDVTTVEMPLVNFRVRFARIGRDGLIYLLVCRDGHDPVIGINESDEWRPSLTWDDLPYDTPIPDDIRQAFDYLVMEFGL